MYKNCLVNLTLQITCQWIGIERYKLSVLFELFYIEKWMNFSFFFDHISFVFHYFELIFLKTGVYMEKRGWGVFGGYSRRHRHCRHRRRKKGINFRVIKVNLSFGELKIFQMVQNFNNLQSMSYVFIV